MVNLDINRRVIVVGLERVSLRNKEFCLIQYFFENSGRVLTRTEILEAVWDRNIFCESNTVDVHVSILRRKLKRFSLDYIIKTVHCVGYIFDINY